MKTWPQTDITTRMGVRYPIMQAPMMGATTVEMVAAACEAGALGCYPIGYAMDPARLSAILEDIRIFTAKPFGVNIIVYDPDGDQGVVQLPSSEKPALGSAGKMPIIRELLAPYRTALGISEEEGENEGVTDETPQKTDWGAQIDVLCKYKVNFVYFTCGLPPNWVIAKLDARGVKTVVGVTSLEEALLAERWGASMVVATGTEAGGATPAFISEPDKVVGLMALVPMLAARVKVPIFAAGGIVTAETVRAALSLGAAGVVMGTAFVLSYESAWPFKAKILQHASSKVPPPTVVTRVYSGKPTRVLATPLTAGINNHDTNIPHWPLHWSNIADFRAYLRGAPDHEYCEIPLGANYALASGKSVRDIIYTLIEDLSKR